MKIGPKKEKLKEYGRRYHNAKKNDIIKKTFFAVCIIKNE